MAQAHFSPYFSILFLTPVQDVGNHKSPVIFQYIHKNALVFCTSQVHLQFSSVSRSVDQSLSRSACQSVSQGGALRDLVESLRGSLGVLDNSRCRANVSDFPPTLSATAESREASESPGGHRVSLCTSLRLCLLSDKTTLPVAFRFAIPGALASFPPV